MWSVFAIRFLLLQGKSGRQGYWSQHEYKSWVKSSEKSIWKAGAQHINQTQRPRENLGRVSKAATNFYELAFGSPLSFCIGFSLSLLWLGQTLQPPSLRFLALLVSSILELAYLPGLLGLFHNILILIGAYAREGKPCQNWCFFLHILVLGKVK